MQKTFRKTKRFLTSILIDFWLQLGCHIRKSSARQTLKNRYFFELGLDGRSPRQKRRSKTPQDGQNEAQRRSRKAKNYPKRGPRTAKKVPGQPQGSPGASQDGPKTIYTLTYAKTPFQGLKGETSKAVSPLIGSAKEPESIPAGWPPLLSTHFSNIFLNRFLKDFGPHFGRFFWSQTQLLQHIFPIKF